MPGKMRRVPVLVVGGGTVGLCLAGELGWRGVDCLVIERRFEPDPHPRANAVANRTMEYFRRWGLDHAFLDNGIPPDQPADYHYVTSMHGRSIYKIALPSHNQLVDLLKAGAEDPKLGHSPYLKTILGQNEVDRILRGFVASQAGVETRFGAEVIGFRQHIAPDEPGVVALIRDLASGEVEEVFADYMVACDGGRSLVRTTLDVPLAGSGGLSRFVAIHFEAPGLNRKFGPGNIYFQMKRRFGGFLMNWDGGTTYTYHYLLHEGEDWRSLDATALIQALAGWPIEVALQSVQPWSAHRLVAEAYRKGRVFLAGDAAHLFTPTGGFGMNTGIADAMDLAWKLQASLRGWAGPRLLDTYEEERRPIAIQNTDTSAGYFFALKHAFRFGEVLDEEGPAGDLARRTLKFELDGQVGLIDSSGLLLGYRYEGSSICVADGTLPVPYNPQFYWPTTRPGHRAAHLWLDPETSVLDLFGPDFTLLRLDPEADVGPLIAAAARVGLPLKQVDVFDPKAAAVYERKLVLVRPDMMVAWRGDETPEDPQRIVDLVRGAS